MWGLTKIMFQLKHNCNVIINGALRIDPPPPPCDTNIVPRSVYFKKNSAKLLYWLFLLSHKSFHPWWRTRWICRLFPFRTWYWGYSLMVIYMACVHDIHSYSNVTVKHIDCWHVTFALKFLLFCMCYQKSKLISEYINIKFEYLVV